MLAGCSDEAIEGVDVVVRPALEATSDDVNGADGLLLGTTANFGYMSGALKHFFDSTFLDIGGALGDDGWCPGGGGKAVALWVHGRYDTAGAVRSVQSIVRRCPGRGGAGPGGARRGHRGAHCRGVRPRRDSGGI